MPSLFERTWSVIMAGGAGTRFWPLSRQARPKQLLDLFGGGSLLRITFERMRPVVPPERTVVVTAAHLADAVREALPEVPPDQILEEPCGRNTAPAIAWAAVDIARRAPDAVLAVLPADQHIVDVDGFRKRARLAVMAAAEGRIVTLGITPTRPETGYGYILAGEGEDEVRPVAAFKEKPDVATAVAYIADGGYLWNAGMFFMPAALLLRELGTHAPDVLAGVQALYADGPPDEATLARAWPELPSISIDYAVMERSEAVSVVPGTFGWSDVGSWRSLFDFRKRGEDSFHQGDVIEIDGRDNVLVSEGGIVAAVGVHGLAIVHTPDATLVCRREMAQRVREVVAVLRKRKREDVL